MKNILYIAPDISVKGGISMVIKNYLSTALPKRYRIFFVSSNKDGTKVLKLAVAIAGLIKTLYYLLFERIDIVHIHGSDPTSSKRKYIYFKLVSLFRCKIIYHFHGNLFYTAFPNLPRLWRKRFKKLFEHSDIVIGLSEDAKSRISAFAPAANIVVIPNSISLPNLEQEIKCESAASGLQLCFLGHIVERKGIFDLLKVIKQLNDVGINVQLSVGGAGEIDRFEREIQVLGLGDRVEYLGWISEKERDSLLRKTDLFILPSYSEGMPMTILEAMSYKIPVISTYVGGIPELIIDGITGYMIQPGDVNDLYAKILELVSDDNKRRTFGQRGRNRIEEKYNLTVNINKIDEIYRLL